MRWSVLSILHSYTRLLITDGRPETALKPIARARMTGNNHEPEIAMRSRMIGWQEQLE